jgi:hypothetical protein
LTAVCSNSRRNAFVFQSEGKHHLEISKPSSNMKLFHSGIGLPHRADADFLFSFCRISSINFRSIKHNKVVESTTQLLMIGLGQAHSLCFSNLKQGYVRLVPPGRAATLGWHGLLFHDTQSCKLHLKILLQRYYRSRMLFKLGFTPLTHRPPKSNSQAPFHHGYPILIKAVG